MSAELREAFQALSRPEQDIFLMVQLKAMNGGEITASRRLKKKTPTNGIIPPIHGNVKKVPQWKTKITIDITVATTVKSILENYAEINGLPSPGRNVNRIIQSLTLLPAETSYKSVYSDFIAGLENDNTLKLLKYDAFRKVWHQLKPYIQIMSPRTDLCDTCQHFRNGLQYNAPQNVHVPHSDQQVSKIYYLSPRKVHLFGIQDEAVREQNNYVLDEDEIIGKGPNGTLSMVFDGIKRLNKGEKYLKITCVNAGGQNKNNATI
ncbi:hypothetical protein G9A89_007916 [Geosiphon pyriformis]|nr:hypothetical protein G9A89_007916 [Geosiphon pyriformis]